MLLGRAPGEPQERRSYPSPVVLLAPLDAWGASKLVKAIQELAGHADLTMTQRYMHLSPAALDAAIGLLDRPSGEQSCGDMLATGSPLQK